MQFWRIENVNGKGPYESGAAKWCDSAYHPVPEKDGLKALESHEICGFKNLVHLRGWFTDDLIEILSSSERGTFVVTLYEAPETAVRHGMHQAVADKKQLDYRWSVPVEELHTL